MRKKLHTLMLEIMKAIKVSQPLSLLDARAQTVLVKFAGHALHEEIWVGNELNA